MLKVRIDAFVYFSDHARYHADGEFPPEIPVLIARDDDGRFRVYLPGSLAAVLRYYARLVQPVTNPTALPDVMREAVQHLAAHIRAGRTSLAALEVYGAAGTEPLRAAVRALGLACEVVTEAYGDP